MKARRAIGAALLALAMVAVGCGPGRDAVETVTVELRQGSATLRIRAEIAATPADRQRGLMGRRTLAAGAGMLFVFPAPVKTGFWMKDTLIPLNIAFIAAGAVVEVRAMTPCTRDPCPLTTPAAAYDSALEVNAGSFARAGVTVGARVRVSGPLPRVS